jgi:D-3-phosphoglycerate dehydrogenase
VARGGVENIAVDAASQRGIVVLHIVGRHASAVAEFSLGLMLAEMRHIARAHSAIQRGLWYREAIDANECFELSSKTIGLVGFGAVAQVLAKRLAGFDVRVLAYDPYIQANDIRRAGAEPVDLETLLREADVVSLHARLSPETRGMIGQRELVLMKPTAYLINTARAGLIDEAALVTALRARRIKGAALDVFEQEPLTVDHPLCHLDNVTLTAHQAGSTHDALTNSARLVTQATYRYLFEGWTDWVVNYEELQ